MLNSRNKSMYDYDLGWMLSSFLIITSKNQIIFSIGTAVTNGSFSGPLISIPANSPLSSIIGAPLNPAEY